MSIYTFIMEYDGATMIRQVRAIDENAAVRELGGQMFDEFSPEWGNEIGVQTPIPVDGVESVWCIAGSIADKLLLVHFTVTNG